MRCLPLASLPQDALEPHIDAATMKFHHDFHHQAYINNLNKASPPRNLAACARCKRTCRVVSFRVTLLRALLPARCCVVPRL